MFRFILLESTIEIVTGDCFCPKILTGNIFCSIFLSDRNSYVPHIEFWIKEVFFKTWFGKKRSVVDGGPIVSQHCYDIPLLQVTLQTSKETMCLCKLLNKNNKKWVQCNKWLSFSLNFSHYGPEMNYLIVDHGMSYVFWELWSTTFRHCIMPLLVFSSKMYFCHFC